MEKQFYTREEVANILGVTHQSVSNLLKRGILLGTNTYRNGIRIDKDDLDKYLKQIKPAAREFLEVEKLKNEINEEYVNTVNAHKAILNTRYVCGIFEWTAFKKVISLMCDFIKFGTPLTDKEAMPVISFLEGETSDMIAQNYGRSKERIRQRFFGSLYKLEQYLINFRKVVEANKEHVRTIAEQAEEIKQLKEEIQYLKRCVGKRQLRKGNISPENKESLKSLLATPILECDLSVRALNFLHYCLECESIGDVVRHDINDLYNLRNCGRKTIAEIVDFLEKNGLELGMKFNFNI